MSAPRAAVPLYLHPAYDRELWEQVLHPGAADLVVVNVDSGPGRTTDPIFAEALRNAPVDKGPTVLGYVDTDYGRRSLRDIRTDVRRWREEYGVTSVFLDQVASGIGSDGHLDARVIVPLTGLVHALRRDGARVIAGNPGAVPHPWILRLLDITCVRETDLETHLTGPGEPPGGVDPSRVWHLVYDCPPDRAREAIDRSVELGAGYVGLAADALPHPWGSVEYLNPDGAPVSSCG
ncbi:spherulation-specific family 4 protein [Dietzia massiliensis]|uniref:spherulation-specific family 4 protein n=1 Tax=Dietzia massiliensis TaxID=2697499 RepID=UPI001BCC0C50|nr:spherulation-specific family 4 protein [Dietzia massiliensis]MBS7547681.1 hypothetical protein [Dietzia massiliensis]